MAISVAIAGTGWPVVKSFTEGFLTGKRKKNNGELDMYFIENDHEAIVSREVFNRVQKKKLGVREKLD